MRVASAHAWTGVQLLSVLFVAVATAAAAQISFPLPFTPVPFSTADITVLIGGAVLGSRLGATSQILYLMAGIAGLPVFANAPELPQGLARVFGPTGGYLMAYPVAAFATGWLAERGMDRRYFTSIVAMTVGLAIILFGGVAWISRVTGVPAALAAGFYPFVVIDLIKVVAAGSVLPTAWKFLRP